MDSHNGSSYDYYFVIKELTKECELQFECLGVNKEKYLTLSVPIRKSHLEYLAFNNGSLIFKSVDSNKSYEKEFNEDLFKRFGNVYKV